MGTVWEGGSPTDVRDGGFESSGPVDQSVAAIDDAFLVEAYEAFLHCTGQFLKGEGESK